MKPVNPKVKRYKYPNGNHYWLVSATLPPHGERYRKKHADELSAFQDRAALIATHSTTVTLEELEQAKTAILILRNSPNPDARSRSILDAANFFSERFSDPKKVLPLPEYIDEFLARKREENLREHTYLELAKYLRDFRDDFVGLNIQEFTKDLAHTYLTKTRVPNRQRKAALNQFLNFLAQTAHSTNYSTRVIQVNPIRLITRARTDQVGQRRIRIMDSSETIAVLEHSAQFNAQRMFAWLLFTGMRPTETLRFWGGSRLPMKEVHGWDAIDLHSRVIHVSGEVSKTRTNRRIQIQPNLVEWLECYQGQDFLTKNWRDKFAWAKSVLPEQKRNISDICRHTFISYLARVASGWHEVELQAGNTKQIQLRHYMDLVQEDPSKFWKIGPASVTRHDIPEKEFARLGYENRRRAILENRKKVRHTKTGSLLPNLEPL